MGDIEFFFDERAHEWDSRHRHSDFAVIDTVFSKSGICENDRALDVGGGTGILAPALIKSGCQFTAIDLSRKMLDRYADKFPKAELIHGDYEQDIFFQPESFSKILIYNSFPHFLNPDLVFQNAFRHLRNGGILAVFHSMSRESLNVKHKKVGGVVGNHFLADDNTLRSGLHDAGFAETIIQDGEFFMLLSRK